MLTIWILGICAGAQPLPHSLNTHHVRTFTPAEGPPAGDARHLAQTGDGPIYVSTARGVAAFDGYAFHPVPLPGFESHVIETAHLDRAGRLWLLTKENDLGYIKDERVHRMPPVRTLRNNPSNSLFETENGLLWINGADGLTRITPEAEDPYALLTTAHGLPDNEVISVFDAPGGRRLIVTHGGMAFMEADTTRPGGIRFVPFAPPGLPPVPSGHSYHSVWANRHGIWLAFDDHVRHYRIEAQDDAPLRPATFTRYDATDRTPPLHVDSLQLTPGQFATFPPHLSTRLRFEGGTALCDGQQASAYCRLLLTRDGTYWITFLQSSTLLHVQNNRATPILLREHLTFSTINHVMLDHESSLWIGTDRGIIQLAPRAVSAMTKSSGLAETFTAPVLQTRDGALWVGTWGGGLHRFDDGRLTRRYTTADGLPHNKIRSLYEAHDGTLWIGTSTGAAALRDGRIDEQLSNINEVRSFAEQDDGTLWLGTAARLVVRRPDGLTTEPDSAFWNRKQIWALHAARDGSLWIGSENGLFRYGGDRLHTYDARHGLRSSFVVAIHDDPGGALWVSTYEDGLHRYRNGRFIAVTTREGLHHNGVWRMLWDDRGGVWMSSDQGVFRVDHDRLHAVADAVARGQRPAEPLSPLVFTETEGLPSRECNRAGPGGWRLRDGRLAFNNLQGLVLIDPERALTPPPPPRTTLHRVVADGQPVPVPPEDPAPLPAGTRQLRFDFAALSFIAPGQNHYRYRLRGYDEAWVDGDTRATATYTNLAPDDYVFEVQSASGMSAWGPPTTAALTLRPLLWQMGWVRLLALGVVIGLLAVAYQVRVRRLLAMERLRLRLASDLHDDVGSNISSIALISEMLTGNVDPDALEQRHLQRIHAAAEETVRSLRDIIWLVDPKHDTLADLVRKMRRVAPTLLNGTPCTFEVAGPIAPYSLDMTAMRHVFLLYKEALHNAAKHAAAQHVAVTVEQQGEYFTLRIRDDGRGFDQAAVNRGYGLANMRRRARAVGGRLEIDSSPSGTQVTFSAKMA